MIRYQSQKQLSFEAFDWPFQTALDKSNRWVTLSDSIPWDDFAESYYQGIEAINGRPTSNARLVIGAMIIKQKLCLSDRETVAQIQENPYLQYFVGLSGFQMEVPFVPSLFVEIRKRMGQSIFDNFQSAIISSMEDRKEKRKLLEEKTDNDDEPPTASSDKAETITETIAEVEEKENQGKLLMDATVAPQAIRYPTDLGLLNEAREFSEQIIDTLYPHTDLKKKPRTYRQKSPQRLSCDRKTETPQW